MKLKVDPDDFRVEEILRLPVGDRGPYTILKLEKRYWNTLDAIEHAARTLGVSRRLFSRAGLKDRYSRSTQYLSFRGSITRTIREDNYTLTPIGKAMHPVLPGVLEGNRFTIVLRDLRTAETVDIIRNAEEIRTNGVPNYFDEQRFGSARHGRGFFAKELMRQHYKGALKLLLCYGSQEDDRRMRAFKKRCLDQWGNWNGCRALAPALYRRVMEYLEREPQDYQGAIKQIDPEMLNLYLLAYQSFLFNQALARLVREAAQEIAVVRYLAGEFVFHRRLRVAPRILHQTIEMPHEKLGPGAPGGHYLTRVLQDEGILVRQFALRKMRFRGVRFKPFTRSAFITLPDLTVGPAQADERYRGRSKMQLQFVLPGGSYATVVVKRLMIHIPGCPLTSNE